MTLASAAPDPSEAAFAVVTLTKRSDFLRAAKGRKVVTPGFILQLWDHRDPHGPARFGFTASKKVGNAVLRNRAKRRLRALVRDVMPKQAQPGCDYVLVARAGGTVDLAYATLSNDLRRAMAKLHKRT